MYILNKNKEKKIQSLLEHIQAAQARSSLDFLFEKSQIQSLSDKILEIAKNTENEEEETKKLEKMKKKTEKETQILKPQIKEKMDFITKIDSQAVVLASYKFFFRTNASLAINNVSEFKQKLLNHRRECHSQQFQLKNSFSSIKNNNFRIIQKIAGINLENKIKSEERKNLIGIVEQYESLNKDNLCSNNDYRGILSFYHSNFNKIAKIVKIDLDSKDLQNFAVVIINWLQKEEFRQSTLTLDYIENIRILLEKNKKYSEVLAEKNDLIQKSSEESYFEKNERKENIKYSKQNVRQIKSAEKSILSYFYQNFLIVSKIVLTLNSIETITKKTESRFEPIKSQIEKYLQKIDLTEKNINEKNSSKTEILLSNSPKVVQGKSLLLRPLISRSKISEIKKNENIQDGKHQIELIVKSYHKIIKKRFKKTLLKLLELLKLISEATEDANEIITLMTKPSNEPLLHLKSLSQTRPKVSFFVSEELPSPYLKPENFSLEVLLSSSKLPEVSKKIHKRHASESGFLIKPQKNTSEINAIEGMIHSMRIKEKIIAKNKFGAKSLAKFPNKFIVKPEFIKRLSDQNKVNSAKKLINLKIVN